MGKKGPSRHLKRYAVPQTLKLPRKRLPWAIKPAPGPHPADKSIPLGTLVKEYLNLTEKLKETKRVLAGRKVMVDGKVRTDLKFPVGLMDVVSIVPLNTHYRISVDRNGRLVPIQIRDSDASFKLCKVVGKHVVKGGRIQLAFHDGRTVVGDFGDYRRGDTVRLSIPEPKVLERIPFERGVWALITGGKNVGRVGRIVDLGTGESRLVGLETPKGETLQTPATYVFPVSKEEQTIPVPEVGA